MTDKQFYGIMGFLMLINWAVTRNFMWVGLANMWFIFWVTSKSKKKHTQK